LVEQTYRVSQSPDPLTIPDRVDPASVGFDHFVVGSIVENQPGVLGLFVPDVIVVTLRPERCLDENVAVVVADRWFVEETR
jgi:hypothetical protein